MRRRPLIWPTTTKLLASYAWMIEASNAAAATNIAHHDQIVQTANNPPQRNERAPISSAARESERSSRASLEISVHNLAQQIRGSSPYLVSIRRSAARSMLPSWVGMMSSGLGGRPCRDRKSTTYSSRSAGVAVSRSEERRVG